MRVVFGAHCTWWGELEEAGELPLDPDACGQCGRVHPWRIPARCERAEPTPHRPKRCCPHCHGRLFKVRNLQAWLDGVNAIPLLRFARGRCYPDLEALQAAYNTAGVEA